MNFHPKQLTIKTFNYVDTTQKSQELCKHNNLVEYSKIIQVLHKKTKKNQ